jgi:hypothetical protein
MRTNEPKGQRGTLVDACLAATGLKNDSALARAMQVDQSYISRIRRGLLGNTVLIKLHQESGISIADLKKIAGIESVKKYTPRVRDLRKSEHPR